MSARLCPMDRSFPKSRQVPIPSKFAPRFPTLDLMDYRRSI
jgi:hypothetical protein